MQHVKDCVPYLVSLMRMKPTHQCSVFSCDGWCLYGYEPETNKTDVIVDVTVYITNMCVIQQSPMFTDFN